MAGVQVSEMQLTSASSDSRVQPGTFGDMHFDKLFSRRWMYAYSGRELRPCHVTPEKN